MHLFLDDIRNPQEACGFLHSENAVEILRTHDYTIVRNYHQFKSWIEGNGLPDLISFDYTLGEQDNKTGYDCAQWLVNYCAGKRIFLPEWAIHSTHITGARIIEMLLRSYTKRRNNEPISFHELALIGEAILKYQPPVTIEQARAQVKWLRENSVAKNKKKRPD